MSIDNRMAAYAYYGITTEEDARAAGELESEGEMDQFPEISFTVAEMPQRLRSLRKLREMTLKEVAEATGLSFSFISDMERGRVKPSIDTLAKLARVYNTPLTLKTQPDTPGQRED